MEKYLYGASIQGIQSFIFKTSKLKEIVGASEIIENLCTRFFRKILDRRYNENNSIVEAAGNIKYIFDNKEDAEFLVARFPREVMKYAPGITISQAIQKIDNHVTYNDMIKLEDKLKAQRNKQIRPLDLGLLITERSRRTGEVGSEYKKEVLDKASAIKAKQNEIATYKLVGRILGQSIQKENIFFDLAELKSKENNHSFIAIIHADGNGLGKLIQQLGQQLEKLFPEEVAEGYRQFSKVISIASENAVKDALLKVQESHPNFKFRPIILGGDDLTIICEAQGSIDFTHHFLQAFEENTKSQIKERLGKYNLPTTHLTACAGIVYAKANYPFHYSIALAESLCAEAKKVAKSMPETESCYLFHKIQSSFVGSFNEIKKRELTAINNNGNKIELSFGPYFINSDTQMLNKAQSAELIDNLNKFITEDVPLSQLRKWISELYNDFNAADDLMERIIKVLNDKKKKTSYGTIRLENLKTESLSCTPVYDLLLLSSFYLK